jgi:hypothetical protein
MHSRNPACSSARPTALPPTRSRVRFPMPPVPACHPPNRPSIRTPTHPSAAAGARVLSWTVALERSDDGATWQPAPLPSWFLRVDLPAPPPLPAAAARRGVLGVGLRGRGWGDDGAGGWEMEVELGASWDWVLGVCAGSLIFSLCFFVSGACGAAGRGRAAALALTWGFGSLAAFQVAFYARAVKPGLGGRGPKGEGEGREKNRFVISLPLQCVALPDGSA